MKLCKSRRTKTKFRRDHATQNRSFLLPSTCYNLRSSKLRQFYTAKCTKSLQDTTIKMEEINFGNHDFLSLCPTSECSGSDQLCTGQNSSQLRTEITYKSPFGSNFWFRHFIKHLLGIKSFSKSLLNWGYNQPPDCQQTKEIQSKQTHTSCVFRN